MEFEFLPEAEEDLREHARFYECQQEGLSVEYLDHIHAEVLRLCDLAEVAPGKSFGQYRQFLTTEFPNVIFYRIVSEKLRIVAVFDTRQDRAWIEQQLGIR